MPKFLGVAITLLVVSVIVPAQNGKDAKWQSAGKQGIGTALSLRSTIWFTLEGGSLTGKRQTEFGYDVIRAPLPAVVAVADSINEPRYPSLKGIMGAKSKPQETLSLADLGVDGGSAGEQGSRTEVLALSDPPPRGDTRKIEDDGSAAEQIVAFLGEKRLI